MGIISDNIKTAFKRYREHGDLLRLALQLVTDADYSVRYAWQMGEVHQAIREHIPAPSFECLWYDGENGEYHLLDFDPNGLKRESILIEARGQIRAKFGIESDEIVDQHLYLVDTNAMIKIGE